MVVSRAARQLLGLLLVSAAASPLAAHIVTRGVGTAAMVAIQEKKVLITFDLGFSEMWGQAEMVSMDTDRDGAVNEAEADAYMRRAWDEKVAPFLECRLDGVKLPLRRVFSREANLLGDISPSNFDIYFELEAELPAGVELPGKEHVLEIENQAMKKESPVAPSFYVPMARESHARGLSFQILEPAQLLDLMAAADMYSMMGRKLAVKFDFNQGGSQAGAPSPGPAAGPPPEPAAATPAASPAAAPVSGPGSGPASGPPRLARPESTAPQSDDRFLDRAREAILRGNLSFWEQVVLVLLAMAYGAGHALAPGHGKTVVAAYLVGSRGRISDAVILGLATTFSHTFTVFMAGLAINLAIEWSASSSGALQQRIVVGTSLASGLLLLAMGLGLFFRRWRFAGDPDGMMHHHDHGHGHGHHHGHAHDHHHHDHGDEHVPDHAHEHPHGHGPADHPPAGRLSMWSLLGLGTSGGLVPCPAGMVVILLGLQYHALAFALLLLVFFSLALGSVLVAIGIFVVTGSRLLQGRLKVNRRLLSYLPAFSALFIAGLGAYFTVQTFQMGRTEIAAMLESLVAVIRG